MRGGRQGTGKEEGIKFYGELKRSSEVTREKGTWGFRSARGAGLYAGVRSKTGSGGRSNSIAFGED